MFLKLLQLKGKYDHLNFEMKREDKEKGTNAIPSLKLDCLLEGQKRAQSLLPLPKGIGRPASMNEWCVERRRIYMKCGVRC